ncbi:MAG: hypothetical protein EAZ95_03755 [Bacteroidetes bacterium]|nr:MAG: hypothetical protein EAZ95_03755 [Bacteroidota bacterium]
MMTFRLHYTTPKVLGAGNFVWFYIAWFCTVLLTFNYFFLPPDRPRGIYIDNTTAMAIALLPALLDNWLFRRYRILSAEVSLSETGMHIVFLRTSWLYQNKELAYAWEDIQDYIVGEKSVSLWLRAENGSFILRVEKEEEMPTFGAFQHHLTLFAEAYNAQHPTNHVKKIIPTHKPDKDIMRLVFVISLIPWIAMLIIYPSPLWEGFTRIDAEMVFYLIALSTITIMSFYNGFLRK